MKTILPADLLSAQPDRWHQLAEQTCEMLFASAEVISHRSHHWLRISVTGAVPSADDHLEFQLMGQEKFDAVTESVQALQTRLLALGRQWGVLNWDQLLDGAGRLVALALCRDPGTSQQLHAEILQQAMAGSHAVTSGLADSIAQVAHTAMQPLHMRAVANAHRLGAAAT